jgi:hypothetical protein
MSKESLLLTSLSVSHFGVDWKLRVYLLLSDVCEEIAELLNLFMRFCNYSGLMLRRECWSIGIAIMVYFILFSYQMRNREIEHITALFLPEWSDSNIDRLAVEN